MHSFIVRGRGPFPFDMLRFDSCYPATSTDAAKMEHHRDEDRSIKLTTDSWLAPTKDRWASFLWGVTEEETPD